VIAGRSPKQVVFVKFLQIRSPIDAVAIVHRGIDSHSAASTASIGAQQSHVGNRPPQMNIKAHECDMDQPSPLTNEFLLLGQAPKAPAYNLGRRD